MSHIISPLNSVKLIIRYVIIFRIDNIIILQCWISCTLTKIKIEPIFLILFVDKNFAGTSLLLEQRCFILFSVSLEQSLFISKVLFFSIFIQSSMVVLPTPFVVFAPAIIIVAIIMTLLYSVYFSNFTFSLHCL